MMFSGSNVKPAPGFRIVDYTFTSKGGALQVSATRAMRLCPADHARPGHALHLEGRPLRDCARRRRRGRAGHAEDLRDHRRRSGTAQTTTCERRVDFGFAAGKADFSFDGRRITFHISKHGYLTPFVNGGLVAPTITDVVVADLVHDAQGRIVGHGPLARVTTSTREGVGSYFPAFFPDGRVYYVANTAPKSSDEPKRFHFRVVNPDREVFFANFFTDPGEAGRGRDHRAVVASELPARDASRSSRARRRGRSRVCEGAVRGTGQRAVHG
jgi:hypothetical protein